MQTCIHGVLCSWLHNDSVVCIRNTGYNENTALASCRQMELNCTDGFYLVIVSLLPTDFHDILVKHCSVLQLTTGQRHTANVALCASGKLQAG